MVPGPDEPRGDHLQRPHRLPAARPAGPARAGGSAQPPGGPPRPAAGDPARRGRCPAPGDRTGRGHPAAAHRPVGAHGGRAGAGARQGAQGRSRHPVRPGGGPGPQVPAVQAGRAGARPLPELPPHRHGRLVRRGDQPGHHRGVPAAAGGPHPRPAGPGRHLRRACGAPAGAARLGAVGERAGLLAGTAGRSGGAGAARRPGAPGGAHPERRDLHGQLPLRPAGPGALPRAGAGRLAVHGRGGGAQGGAGPVQRSGRHRDRGADARPYRSRTGRRRRPVHQYDGAALGPLRRDHLRRADRADRRQQPGCVRQPGRAFRPCRRPGAAGAGRGAQPAVPDRRAAAR
ncbi:hypothetical protein SMICM17S_03067 [Streptomyces microflavus]